MPYSLIHHLRTMRCFTKTLTLSAIASTFPLDIVGQPPQDPHWGLYRSFDFINMQTISEVASNWNINQSGFGHGDIVLNKPSNTILIPSTGVQITTRKEEYLSQHYTTGGISLNCTFPDYGFDYGYVEAYIKLSDTYGLWPAFWLWTEKSLCDGTPVSPCSNCPGNNQPLPCFPPMVPSCDYEEVDIFEMTPGIVESTPSSPHYGETHTRMIGTSNYHINPNDNGEYFLTYDINDYTSYHLYGLEWTPTTLTFYIDNNPIRTAPNPGISWNTSIILEQYLAPHVNAITYDPSNPSYWQKFEIPSNMQQYGFSCINNTPAVMDIAYVKIYELNMQRNCPVTEIYTTPNMNVLA